MLCVRAQPKLQSCVPFTPVTGARVLIRHADMRAALTKVVAQTLTKITGDAKPFDFAPLGNLIDIVPPSQVQSYRFSTQAWLPQMTTACRART